MANCARSLVLSDGEQTGLSWPAGSPRSREMGIHQAMATVELSRMDDAREADCAE